MDEVKNETENGGAADVEERLKCGVLKPTDEWFRGRADNCEHSIFEN